jgi:DNA mismatch repair protein MutS2
MNHLYKTFEFDAILEKVATFAKTPMGMAKVLNLEHITEIILIKENLAKLDEAIRIILRFNDCPFDNIDDISDSLNKARKGAILSVLELYRVSNVIEGSRRIKDFAASIPFKDIPYFLEAVDELVVINSVRKEILRCITPSLEIADSASPTLNKIRKEIKQKEQEVRSKLEQIVKNSAELMSDALITFRNDRLVVPLKIANKYALGGIIHDISDSGQTAFVEPQSVIELNASFYRLKQKEKEEIEIILRNLSSLVKENYDVLFRNQEIITDLDFIFAKANYANSINAQIAKISDETEIELHHARHPLIDPKLVVANDFILKGNQKMILITGPNTGGKTVALKTVGLLVLMNQSGLAIPVDGEARLGVFTEIFADIGDEQSISNSLSTFSSHLVRIINVVNNVKPTSLVIIDEIGGGTDPKEGEALGMAVLEHLHLHGGCSLITTHYSNLKSFAIDSGYIINASMEFDKAALKPAYKLQLGIPGQSYAFEISRRLGLPNELIKRSIEFKYQYSTQSEILLEKMEKELNRVKEKEEALAIKEQVIKEKEAELEAKTKDLEAYQEELKTQAEDEVNKLVDVALKEIDEIVASIKEKNSSEIKMHEWIKAKKDLEDLTIKEEIVVDENYEFKKGDYVFINSLNKAGTIVQKKGQGYLVNCGAISLVVKSDDITLTNKPKKQVPQQAKVSTTTGLKHVNAECNIIGLRVEEALNVLDKYLDDALLVHLKTVRIIHGHGSGALRTAVHNYLRTKNYVKEFRLGGMGEGGVGATVVTLGD